MIVAMAGPRMRRSVSGRCGPLMAAPLGASHQPIDRVRDRADCDGAPQRADGWVETFVFPVSARGDDQQRNVLAEERGANLIVHVLPMQIDDQQRRPSRSRERQHGQRVPDRHEPNRVVSPFDELRAQVCPGPLIRAHGPDHGVRCSSSADG